MRNSKQFNLIVVTSVSITFFYLMIGVAHATQYYEDFESAGADWTGTIFSTLSSQILDATSGLQGTGVPNTTPPLPINAGDDKEGYFMMKNPAMGGGWPFRAWLSNMDESEDMAMGAYISGGAVDSETHTDFVLRMGNLSDPRRADGYVVSLEVRPNNYNSVVISQMRNGIIRSDYPRRFSALFGFDFANEVIRMRAIAIGDEITAYAWRVSTDGYEIIESPIILNPAAQNPYALTMIDSFFSSGTAGIRGFLSKNSTIHVDDILIQIPLPDPPIEATVEITPSVLNLNSNGKWITCYAWLPEEYDIIDVNFSSLMLEQEFKASWSWIDEDQQTLMAKFPRSKIQDILLPGEMELLLTGQLSDGTEFEGVGLIKVIDNGGKK